MYRCYPRDEMSDATTSTKKTTAKGGADTLAAGQIVANPLLHFAIGLALGGGLVAGMQAHLWWLELLCLAGVLLYVFFRAGFTKTMAKRAADRKQP